MKSIVVIDSDRGNLFSVCRALEQLGFRGELSQNPKVVAHAERLILPGVGAFGDCMAILRNLGLDEAIHKFVDTGRPLLGICLGMQMLLDASDEYGRHEGLGLIRGHVSRMPDRNGDHPLRLPNIGWSRLYPPEGRTWDHSLTRGLTPDTFMYFVHSYHALTERMDLRLAEQRFTTFSSPAIIAQDGIVGCQFHPERSGPAGLSLLQRWLSI